MKISYRTHPILEKLNGENVIDRDSIFDDDQHSFNDYDISMINENWNLNRNSFSLDVNVVSESFVNAAYLSQSKLIPLVNDMIEDGEEKENNICGTIIYGDFVYFVNFNKIRTLKLGQVSFFKFTKSGELLICIINDLQSFISEPFAKAVGGSKSSIRNRDWAFAMILSLFKKHAPVETKYLPANSRTKDITCKYVNDTSLNLTHLDSKWFTNLVKSDSFKVRGHFRLQPKKKDGEWTKELIWIEEFKKDGYTARARKTL